jgi:hypothetical protein
MKRKTSSTELLDKTIWNPRPVIGLLTRAIRESGGSFLLVLGPTFSALLANKALLTDAVGTCTVHGRGHGVVMRVVTVTASKRRHRENQLGGIYVK